LPRLGENSDPFEAVLARRLGLSRQPGGKDCADTAIVAAYCDGAMPPDERTAWEQHFAACARCQQILAGVARISSEQRETEVLSFSHTWRRMWRVAPIAIAATAGAVAFVMVRTRPFRSSEFSSPQELAKMAGTPVQEEAADQLSGSAGGAELSRVSPNNQPTTVLPLRAESLAAPMASTPPRAYSGAATDTAHAAALMQLMGGGPTPVATLPTAAPLAMRGPVASSEIAQAQASGVVVGSPDRSGLWRIGPDSSILHYSPERGWRPQESGTKARLVSGSAPSTTVCWAVGTAGTVLKTTDGDDWQTMNSPTTSDLVAVTASSALQATVISADGQRFATNDGGLSWQPR
jgi:hypothetical protein